MLMCHIKCNSNFKRLSKFFPHGNNGFRPKVSSDEIILVINGRSSGVSLVYTKTLKAIIRFRPNLVHRNIIIDLRSSSEMENNCQIYLIERESLFLVHFANSNIRYKMGQYQPTPFRNPPFNARFYVKIG